MSDLILQSPQLNIWFLGDLCRAREVELVEAESKSQPLGLGRTRSDSVGVKVWRNLKVKI